MKKKFKVKTIEDIALQFIRHTDPHIPQKKINSNDTIIDTKFYIKKYKKNPDQISSNSFSKLIPYEEENTKSQEKKDNLKIIKFYKLPQKILGEEDEEFFLENNKSIIQNTYNNTKNNFKSKLREIKPLKFNNKKTKIFFNINYKNASDIINQIYLPLLQNLESISSIKTNTESTIACIVFFNSNDSIFDLLNTKEEKNNIISNNILELMTELKTFETIELSLIVFILHIILEAKIEYIDNFNEDDVVAIYQDCFLVLNKLYEIIILMLHLNEKNNNLNNTNTYNTNKFVKDFFKEGNKINNNEQSINRINENISTCLKTFYNSCNILLGNLIMFKKESGNLENPDETENKFLSNLKSNGINKEDPKEKIFLSKEFQDQYNTFKTTYLYLTKNNKNNNNDNKKQKKENYDFLPQSETTIILSKLTTVLSSFKEISNNFMLYFTNFKILLEKNKVKPPFLGPLSNPNKIFTLVVDLDETLVHYVEEENRAYVQVRPYADYFLNEMGKYFEIVIFTAAAEDYADIVLNELDKNNSIDYKLYRKHTEQINGVFIKDLSKLGRDINKVVIIDNNKDNFSLQPENGLHICSFLGDQNDDELYLLCDDLMKIVKGNKKDLRPAVKEIDEIMKKRYKNKNVVLE